MRYLFLFFLLVPMLSYAGGYHQVFKDPAGDDKGPGTYVYPMSSEYKSGSFDLLEMAVTDKGGVVRFVLKFNSRIRDPWKSKDWTPPGQGFSLQFVQIYVDTDAAADSGYVDGLPGLNIKFRDDAKWEKVILVSPQALSRVQSEIDSKAKKFAKDIIVPGRVKVSGRKLEFTVPISELGEPRSAAQKGRGWGFQAVVQSNEGYPSGTNLLTRDVNEYEGDHRFGGGSDWNCDPQVLDILVAPAMGTQEEIQAQYETLKYKCAGEDLNKAELARLPMVIK